MASAHALDFSSISNESVHHPPSFVPAETFNLRPTSSCHVAQPIMVGYIYRIRTWTFLAHQQYRGL